jgi:hypothetical protein
MDASDRELTTHDLASSSAEEANRPADDDEPAKGRMETTESDPRREDTPRLIVTGNVDRNDRDEPADRNVRDEPADRNDQEEPADSELEPLLSSDESESYQERWRGIQTRFVDEPRSAVENADGLVAEIMKRVAETFSQERTELERHWDRGDDVSTEDLRVALQRYRSFFHRLLAA